MKGNIVPNQVIRRIRFQYDVVAIIGVGMIIAEIVQGILYFRFGVKMAKLF
jgi:uncharacterized membrane protein YciS (DUF1049 family)